MEINIADRTIFNKENIIKMSNRQNSIVIITLIVVLLIRVYLSQFDGLRYDIDTFKSWSTVYNIGITNFYSSMWSDYPPFYIYILWIVGAIYKLFSSSFDVGTTFFTILIKFPANIADIFTALLILKILRKYTDFKTAYFGMVMYVFNPAIIYNSAIWGQVDSINTFFILVSIMLMISDKLEMAGISLAVAILTKPQSLVVLPFVAILLTKDLTIKNRNLLRLVKIFVMSIFAFIILALPFFLKTPYELISRLIKIYISGYGQYIRSSMNAFNFWSLLGPQKPDDTILLLSLSYRTLGYIIFGLLFTYVMIRIMIRNKEKDEEDENKNGKLIYFALVVLLFGFFMFFTRIHERYLFPMFAPLVIVASMDRRLMYVYWIMTFTFLFNLYYVLQALNYSRWIPESNMLIISGINLGIFVYILYCFSKPPDSRILTVKLEE